MELEKYDIVVLNNNKIVQYLDSKFDSGIIIQDIHTKRDLTFIGLVKRMATKDEIKWFCENSEHVNFIPPNKAIR